MQGMQINENDVLSLRINKHLAHPKCYLVSYSLVFRLILEFLFILWLVDSTERIACDRTSTSILLSTSRPHHILCLSPIPLPPIPLHSSISPLTNTQIFLGDNRTCLACRHSATKLLHSLHNSL